MSAATDFAELQKLAPKDAVAWLMARGAKLTKSYAWQDVFQDEHGYQFTVSRLARLDLLQALHDAGARFTAVSEERGVVSFGDPGVLVVIDPIDALKQQQKADAAAQAKERELSMMLAMKEREFELTERQREAEFMHAQRMREMELTAKQREIEIQIEEWVYNFGSQRFMQLLTFEDGRLKQIQDLGYGQ